MPFIKKTNATQGTTRPTGKQWRLQAARVGAKGGGEGGDFCRGSGDLGDRSPPAGSRGRAPVGGGDEVEVFCLYKYNILSVDGKTDVNISAQLLIAILRFRAVGWRDRDQAASPLPVLRFGTRCR